MVWTVSGEDGNVSFNLRRTIHRRKLNHVIYSVLSSLTSFRHFRLHVCKCILHELVSFTTCNNLCYCNTFSQISKSIAISQILICVGEKIIKLLSQSHSDLLC